MSNYKERVSDQMLLRRLQGKGAILIEGPKWCGKTTSAAHIAGSMLNLGEMSVLRRSREIMQLQPEVLLEGAVPRLLDEWETIPDLWDMVRGEVDRRNKFGQFILTGSTVPPRSAEIIHSGTGRIGRMKMRTMSLVESGESDGSVSLAALFDSADIGVVRNSLALDDIAYLTCRGGWPQTTMLSDKVALDQAFDYLEAIIGTDIHRLDETKRNGTRMRNIMRSYARNIGTPIAYKAIVADIVKNDNLSINDDTVADYIDALRRLFVVEDMEAWNPNLRSKAAIRQTVNRYFVDPSIGTAALGLGPKDLKNDLNTFGLMFECMAVRDLRVYADSLDGKVYHYRDSNGLECDTVIHRRDGSYGLVEIKLGGPANIELAAKALNKLESIIDTDRMPAPSFKMVLVAVGEYGFRRKDGVYVIPIGCLRN